MGPLASIKIKNSKIINNTMYIIKVMIQAILTIVSVLKVDNIIYTRNLHDPLGITEPLTRYRMSYECSTTNIINTKDTLSHKDIIKRGTFKSLKTKEKDQENINLQNNTKFTENFEHNDKFTENLQHNEKCTENVQMLGDRIPENKKRE